MLATINNSDRSQLLFAPCHTPSERLGERLTCEFRDDRVIVSPSSDA
jgi:hypothetical protein